MFGSRLHGSPESSANRDVPVTGPHDRVGGFVSGTVPTESHAMTTSAAAHLGPRAVRGANAFVVPQEASTSIAGSAPCCSCRCPSGSRPPTSGLFVLLVAVGAGAVGSAQGLVQMRSWVGVPRRVFQAVKVLVRWWRRHSPARLSGQVCPAGWAMMWSQSKYSARA